MFDAFKNPNPGIARSSGHVTASTGSGGTYQITFDRDISGCADSATVGYPYATSGVTDQGQVSAEAISARTVFVATRDPNGTLAPHSFSLAVFC